MNIYIYEGERNQKISSEILIKKVLNLYNIECNMGLSLEEIDKEEICRKEKGKPYFKKIPLEFSISHSGDIWVCVMGNSKVGIDIQMKKPVSAIEIAKRFFTKEESKLIEETDEKVFFKIWTMKEAFVKFTGEGIFYGLDKFSVVKDGKFIDIIESPDQCYFRKIEISKLYECYICLNEIEKTETRNIFRLGDIY